MSLNQRDFAPRSGAEGDTVPARCIKEPPQTCSLPRLLTGQRPLQSKSYAYKAQEDKLNPYRRTEVSKLKLPPIRDPLKLREQSAQNIKELKNQNYVLQQQLKDSKMENKLLKNVLHRHTVALQQYQDLEGSISQIQEQHRNEVKALRKLLSETRLSRDTLVRKLQTTEKELLDCKDRINHLQWRVCRNPNLLEKEELTRKLSEFTIQLEEKERRIQFLEKSNMLLQGSLNRQVASEYKKISKTTEVSLGLQSEVGELTKKIQPDRMREIEASNIYGIRSRKQGRKGKQSKMVQTEEFVSTNSDPGSRLKSELSDTDENPQKWQSPDSSDYVSRRSRTSERRSKSSKHSEEAGGREIQGKRCESSEDTQESEEENDEEENEEKSKNEDDEGDNNEDGGGGGRPDQNNNEEKGGMEGHDEERFEDEGMDQNEGEEETEEKEDETEETRFEEDFKEMTNEEEERDYVEEQEERNELQEKDEEVVEEQKGEEEEEQMQKDEGEEAEEVKEEGEEGKQMGDKEQIKNEMEIREDNVKEDEKKIEVVEENVMVMVVKEEVKQQTKRKEKGDQKDIKTYKKCSMACILREPKVATQREPKRLSRPKVRRKYNFTPVTKNLHLGKPAYSGVHLRYYKSSNVPAKEETLYCRNRKRSAEIIDDIYLSDEHTDPASDGSDLDLITSESSRWT
ncbi:trichohyalin-like [Corythoichthys intestinalis]|uniref:trichohyalin-like n=1 Tax=Corythoichthys intestinalis TaxID=161448 RepID=UPI0025A5DA21|nr:trichohyalin-like [Corythoichthys intestinalis]